jgi:hypothetical protein
MCKFRTDVHNSNLRLKRLRSNQQSTTAHINAAFPLFTFNSVLIAMSEIQASSYQLLCLIEGESVVFPVEVACSAIVRLLPSHLSGWGSHPNKFTVV